MPAQLRRRGYPAPKNRAVGACSLSRWQEGDQPDAKKGGMGYMHKKQRSRSTTQLSLQKKRSRRSRKDDARRGEEASSDAELGGASGRSSQDRAEQAEHGMGWAVGSGQWASGLPPVKGFFAVPTVQVAWIALEKTIQEWLASRYPSQIPPPVDDPLR
ncbi:hypothetical protein FQN53_002096 [Emmonsiellopsis sp. PD_33]|nr:hypothetical protein FQN53_002096 [Emmonsiellopsis sp. PD_33]